MRGAIDGFADLWICPRAAELLSIWLENWVEAEAKLDIDHAWKYLVSMPATLDAVTREALVLPPDQRLALARKLLDSVDLEPTPGAEAAWEAEIARRVARFKAGESTPVPAGEVFARLRQIAPD